MTGEEPLAECCGHEWHDVAEIGDWFHSLAGGRASHPKTVREIVATEPNLGQERTEPEQELTARIIANSRRIDCEHALSAMTFTDGRISLDNGVHLVREQGPRAARPPHDQGRPGTGLDRVRRGRAGRAAAAHGRQDGQEDLSATTTAVACAPWLTADTMTSSLTPRSAASRTNVSNSSLSDPAPPPLSATDRRLRTRRQARRRSVATGFMCAPDHHHSYESLGAMVNGHTDLRSTQAKSRGDQPTEYQRSYKCPGGSSFFPFLALQLSHTSCRLVTSFNPPSARGTMWSKFARFIGVWIDPSLTLQYVHRPRSLNSTASLAQSGIFTRLRTPGLANSLSRPASPKGGTRLSIWLASNPLNEQRKDLLAKRTKNTSSAILSSNPSTSSKSWTSFQYS